MSWRVEAFHCFCYELVRKKKETSRQVEWGTYREFHSLRPGQRNLLLYFTLTLNNLSLGKNAIGYFSISVLVSLKNVFWVRPTTVPVQSSHLVHTQISRMCSGYKLAMWEVRIPECIVTMAEKRKQNCKLQKFKKFRNLTSGVTECDELWWWYRLVRPVPPPERPCLWHSSERTSTNLRILCWETAFV